MQSRYVRDIPYSITNDQQLVTEIQYLIPLEILFILWAIHYYSGHDYLSLLVIKNLGP